MQNPYLPDIIEGVVQRVSDAFSSRDTDPFEVFFDKGIYTQVSKNVYKNRPNSFPLIWLVMPYTTQVGQMGLAGIVNGAQLIIAMPTDATYTQQDRDDITFKPRLLPIYEILLQEMKREQWFLKDPKGVQHSYDLRPYWGGGDVNGTDNDNLFKKKIDAIVIKIPSLKILSLKCGSGDYAINTGASGYPTSASVLAFFDDIELVVDRGNTGDPVSGTTSVIIPSLKGQNYQVVQRVLGPLRKETPLEVVDDSVNGGFGLNSPLKFNTGDSYFIRIRPKFVSSTTGLTGERRNNVGSVFIENNS